MIVNERVKCIKNTNCGFFNIGNIYNSIISYSKEFVYVENKIQPTNTIYYDIDDGDYGRHIFFDKIFKKYFITLKELRKEKIKKLNNVLYSTKKHI